jgi:hypothetical protein
MRPPNLAAVPAGLAGCGGRDSYPRMVSEWMHRLQGVVVDRFRLSRTP